MPGFSYGGGGGLSNSGLGSGSSLSSYQGNSRNNGNSSGSSSWGAGWTESSGGSFTIGFNRTETGSTNQTPGGNGGGGGGGGSSGSAAKPNPIDSRAGQYYSDPAKQQWLTTYYNAAKANGSTKNIPGMYKGAVQAMLNNDTQAQQQGQQQQAAQQQQEQQRQQQAAQQQQEQQRQQQAAQQQQEQQRQQQAAAAAEQQRQAEAARQAEAERQRQAEAARQEAARIEAERVEKQYQTNLAAVRERAVDIGRNSIYGTGNLESQRQYNEALSGLRPEDQRALASTMSDAREAARAENQKAQVAERDKALAEVNGKVANTSRVAGVLGQIGEFLGYGTGGGNSNGFGSGGQGTLSGTLMNGAKWGMRGLEALGPAGGILGALGGMIANNVEAGEMAENLRGYNPNGLGGVVSAGDLAQQATNFSSPLWNRNGGRGQDREAKTTTGTTTNTAGPQQAKPVDKQVMGALNSLIPTSARTAMEAGQIASNQYLRALHGRYAKYMLATGAEGSGTSLLQRTAGGQGALGGTSGRLLYSSGGNS
ncbi:hypothetical protein [Leclercia sp. Marseille-Q4284]|uniref:hypothetical protein n=1 Tax=Leclercia sp. Marseille-Q4284 TaxID=2866582 RepID=UPI001CE45A75|nr:hypothetical protein [Leclercia sp. Marseille-Q4284]